PVARVASLCRLCWQFSYPIATRMLPVDWMVECNIRSIHDSTNGQRHLTQRRSATTTESTTAGKATSRKTRSSEHQEICT
ncbi:hypothetical protein PoB_005540900, partial [Plakobranchus ocellatus]